jgi:hypothetical protein
MPNSARVELHAVLTGLCGTVKVRPTCAEQHPPEKVQSCPKVHPNFGGVVRVQNLTFFLNFVRHVQHEDETI